MFAVELAQLSQSDGRLSELLCDPDNVDETHRTEFLEAVIYHPESSNMLKAFLKTSLS